MEESQRCCGSEQLPASRIVTTSRARTAPEQVENLVIMKCNMRLLREMKTNQ